MMFCSNCGSKIDGNDAFCGECGAAVPRGAEQTRPLPQNQQFTPLTSHYAQAPQKKDNLLPLIITLATVVIISAGVIAFMLMRPSSAPDISGGQSLPSSVPSPTPSPTRAPTPTPTPSPTPQKAHTYEIVKADVTWWEAYSAAQRGSGHLVSINSEAEFYRVTQMADEYDIKVIWVGAHRNNESSWDMVSWVTGEPITFTKWYPGEPSYRDKDGTIEDMLALYKINGEWYFNDTSNDITRYYSGKIGYVIEDE